MNARAICKSSATAGMHLPVSFLTRLAQALDKQLPVFDRAENGLPMVTPVHDVVNGTGILHTELSSHGERLGPPADLCRDRLCDTENRPLVGRMGEFGG